MKPERVGFVGLGAIGWPMAAQLAKRGRLVVWNRSPDRAHAFAGEHNANVAETPAALARASDIVVTCLPNSPEVEAVTFGPDRLVEGMRPGGLLVDCTSGIPARSRAIAEQLAGYGVDFLDAPVSGGTNGAEAGTLAVFVGGSAAAYHRAEPVLSAFGDQLVHVGAVGAGHAVKAINNAFLGLHILALGEGLSALVKAGIDAATAVAVINSASGRSFVSEVLVPDRVLTGTWPQTFRLALLSKDTDIACDLMADMELSAPTLRAAQAGLREALSVLPNDPDYLEAIKVAEERAGVVIRGTSDG